MPEVGLILHREHAYELYLELDEVAVVEVDVVDHLDVDVLVLVDEVGVEVLEQHDVPVDDDLSRVGLVLLFVWYLCGKRKFMDSSIADVEHLHLAISTICCP